VGVLGITILLPQRMHVNRMHVNYYYIALRGVSRMIIRAYNALRNPFIFHTCADLECHRARVLKRSKVPRALQYCECEKSLAVRPECSATPQWKIVYNTIWTYVPCFGVYVSRMRFIIAALYVCRYVMTWDCSYQVNFTTSAISFTS
jgi:hypothetical protein